MNTVINLLKTAQEAFKEQNLDEAEKCLLEVITIDPSNAVAHYILGLIASATWKNAQALKYFSKAASLCNNDPKIFYHYGAILQRTAQYGKAVKQYEKAISLKPDHLPALNNYSAAMNLMGNNDKAEAAARKIIEIDPSHIDPHINLGNILKDLGRIEEAIESYRNALKIKPGHEIAGSNLLLCLCYSNKDAKTLLDEHKKWEERVGPDISKKNHKNRHIDPEKCPLRIGYISADFKTHSVAYYIEPILENHDKTQFEIFCYSDVVNPDPVTKRIENLELKWQPIYGKNNNQVADLINEDKIDILVDLAGHAGNKRLSLFLRNLAPLQVTYIGYPNTTGLSTIDYRLTDDWADPEGQDRFYTEKLYRLPGGFLCYRPPVSAPPITESPALQNGYITFGSFNNLAKVNPHTIKVWAKILETVPKSKLMIKTKPLTKAFVRERYQNLFAQNSIDANRLILKGHASSLEEHLKRYGHVDIALDTFPYNGTTTTCEALLMGVPVITLAGKYHAGRVGASLLSRIGLSGMIAHDTEKYVALASFLAHDISRLSKLRKGLRNALAQSPLCDVVSFTRTLENAYRDMWRQKAESRKQ